MELHHLFPMPYSNHKSKRVGRGLGSGKGKTSGRGTKGQRARSGVSINGFEGGQTPLYRRLPKRGFTSLNKVEYQLINLYDIEYLIEVGIIKPDTLVNKELLIELGLINNLRQPIKLLADGEEVGGSLQFNLDAYSAKARECILASGGSIVE